MQTHMKKLAASLLSLSLLGVVFMATPAAAKADTAAGVNYRAHIQHFGWQIASSNGNTAGTTGKSLRLEALDISLTGAPAGASISYEAHVQHTGWQNAMKDGATAGTTGKSLRVEALKITLNGMPGYSVRYRAHVQQLGWLPWQQTADGGTLASAGIAGTTGRSLRVEAVQIELVRTAPTVESVEDVAVTTEAGTAPTLPETVTATMSDGTRQAVSVNWEAIDASQYADGGDFSVYGEIPDSDVTAAANVKVHSTTSWADGTYVVGSDLPAGKYILTASDGLGGALLFATSSDATPSNATSSDATASDAAAGELVGYDIVMNRSIQTLTNGQILTITGAKMVPAVSAPKVDLSGKSLTDGTYEAGTDIPAGTYTIIAEDEQSQGIYYLLNDTAHTQDFI